MESAPRFGRNGGGRNQRDTISATSSEKTTDTAHSNKCFRRVGFTGCLLCKLGERKRVCEADDPINECSRSDGNVRRYLRATPGFSSRLSLHSAGFYQPLNRTAKWLMIAADKLRYCQSSPPTSSCYPGPREIRVTLSLTWCPPSKARAASSHTN